MVGSECSCKLAAATGELRADLGSARGLPSGRTVDTQVVSPCFPVEGAITSLQGTQVLCGQGTSPLLSFLPKDQFHKMVELTMAARQAYRTMLEKARQELAAEPGAQGAASPPAQGPSGPEEDGPPGPAGKEEPHYSECQGRGAGAEHPLGLLNSDHRVRVPRRVA